MSDEGSMTKSDIKNNLMNTYKTITVCYIVTGVNIELQVKLSMTVKELKKKNWKRIWISWWFFERP